MIDSKISCTNIKYLNIGLLFISVYDIDSSQL